MDKKISKSTNEKLKFLIFDLKYPDPFDFKNIWCKYVIVDALSDYLQILQPLFFPIEDRTSFLSEYIYQQFNTLPTGSLLEIPHPLFLANPELNLIRTIGNGKKMQIKHFGVF